MYVISNNLFLITMLKIKDLFKCENIQTQGMEQMTISYEESFPDQPILISCN